MAKSMDNGGSSDSTNKIPMVDLETVLDAVSQIRDKAVETAALPDVARALGYANATSTPFYRRLSAGRLFNLLSQRSSLTQEAINYIKPHDEGMKADVLKKAILGIPAYADLVSRYAGKKINVELVANSLGKDLKLSDACAATCAKAFEASLRFAGMLAPDETVAAIDGVADGGSKERGDPPTPEQRNGAGDSQPPRLPKNEQPNDVQSHTIYLDKAKLRRCTVTAPLDVTRAEYDRICRWLEFTILIDEPQATKGP